MNRRRNGYQTLINAALREYLEGKAPIFEDALRRIIREELKSSVYLVDLKGFEPLTSSMPWKRAPNCATGPLRREFLY